MPPRYRYPAVPIARLLDDAARDFPDRPGTWTDGAELSWRQLRELADGFAGGLSALGVGAGDRVAVVLPNLPATVVSVAGISRLGGVVVPLDPAAPPAALARRLAATRCRVAVATVDALPALLEARADGTHLEHVVVTATADWGPRRSLLRGRRRRSPMPDADGLLAWDDVVGAAAHRVPQAPVAGGDPAVLHQPPGEPDRAVVTSTAAAVAAAFQARLWIPDVRAGHERVLAAEPFASPRGFTLGLLPALLSAATLVLVPNPDGLAVAVSRGRPTLATLTPGLGEALLHAPIAERGDLRCLRAALSTGGPLTAEAVDRFEAATGGGRIRNAHASRETGALTHANPVYGRSRPGAIGLPVSDTVAYLADPADPARPCPPGQPGRLLISGPQLMTGYLDDPPATSRVLRDGWLVTDELARVDDDGVFTLVGRLDGDDRADDGAIAATAGREEVA